MITPCSRYLHLLQASVEKVMEDTHELNGKMVEVKKAEARSGERNRYSPYGAAYGAGGNSYGYGGMGPGVI